mgnify:CR=1 FL=1
MHKGKKHSIKEGYEDFARSEGAEAKKYIDSVRTNNPFGEGLDDIMDEESRRRESGYYVKGTTISKGKKVDTPDLGTSRKSALNMLGVSSPLDKKVSWKYGKGTYSGDLIPSMETSTHRYARTHNGKIKSLPKNK